MNDVSLVIQVPELLHNEALKFIERSPEWDQDRLIKAAVSLFLMQNGQIGRIAPRTYLELCLELPPEEPAPEILICSGLNGLLDHLRTDPDGVTDDFSLFIQIEGPSKVSLKTTFSGRHANRVIPIAANCRDYLSGFAFGSYQSIEAVIIALQSQFVETPDKAAILGVLGTLKDERVSTHADDGVTQQVTTRKGLAFGVENTPVPRIVKLAPYRTFAEVDQPVSDFILRLKQGAREGEPPQAALFEADGGRWKLEAIENIHAYLTAGLQQTDDHAELEIPIIA